MSEAKLMTDREFNFLLAEAAQLGREAGKNAAAWWQQDAIGGRVTRGERECAERTLKGMEDGDPMVIDSLPYPNLSGEWAGDPTPQSLMEELDCEDSTTPEEQSELCCAWEDASGAAVAGEIERLCREFLA